MTDELVMRSDAKKNRERILKVAVAELTLDPAVPLSAIAKKAGVGQGTFYRHFPTREALVIEVYRHEMLQVTLQANSQWLADNTLRLKCMDDRPVRDAACC